MHPLVRRVALTATLLAAVATAVGPVPLGAGASSHREAPLISMDPNADNTDVYAFRSPDDDSTITFIANYIPLEAPYGGPNFHSFADDVLYAINVDNDGDANPNIVFEFRFNTTRPANSFLYNNGAVTSLNDPNLLVKTTMDVTRVDFGRGGGRRTIIGSNLPVAPANVGLNSMPNYHDDLVVPAISTRTAGGHSYKIFAGPRDEGFFADLGRIFDLLKVHPGTGNGTDFLADFNVHSIVLQAPIQSLTRDGEPAGPDNAVIGTWSTASRQKVSVLRSTGGATTSGPWVQVSRLGMPLVNEVVIPQGKKDRFNAAQPRNDGQFLSHVTSPEPALLFNLLFPTYFPTACGGQPLYGGSADCPAVPTSNRTDLVTVFLTGVPGLNQPANVRPSEQLRLNMSIPVSASPARLGVLGGDLQGFPNGRRPADDVVDIELQAVGGALAPILGIPGVNPTDAAKLASQAAILSDGVDCDDLGCTFPTTFPYLRDPKPGNESP